MTLKTDDFPTRILWYVAVPGEHNLRYLGFLPSAAKKRDTVRETLGKPMG